jgi:hypothetical protein
MAQHHPFLLRDSFRLDEAYQDISSVLILSSGEVIKYNNSDQPLEIFNHRGALLNTFEYADDWKREKNFRLKGPNGGPGGIIDEEFENGRLKERFSSIFQNGNWHYYKYEFYYNQLSALKEIRTYTKISDIYELSQKEEFIYDTEGRLVSQTTKHIENGLAKDKTKENFRFNALGKLEYFERILYLTNGDSMRTDSKTLDYDSDGSVQVTFEISNFGIDTLKHFHFYDNGSIPKKSEVVYEIIGGQEVLKFKVDTFFGSSQFSNLPDSILKFEYENGSSDPNAFIRLTNEYDLGPDSIVVFKQDESIFYNNNLFPSYSRNTLEWLHFKKETSKKPRPSDGQVLLFPNPANSHNRMTFSGEGLNFEGTQYEIVNALGKLIANGFLESDGSFLSPGQPGAYFIKIAHPEGQFNLTKPFVIY